MKAISPAIESVPRNSRPGGRSGARDDAHGTPGPSDLRSHYRAISWRHLSQVETVTLLAEGAIAGVAFDHRHRRAAQNSPHNLQNSYRHMLRDYEASTESRADIVNHLHRDAIAAGRAASSSAINGLAR